jgi:hypothetical protein
MERNSVPTRERIIAAASKLFSGEASVTSAWTLLPRNPAALFSICAA